MRVAGRQANDIWYLIKTNYGPSESPPLPQSPGVSIRSDKISQLEEAGAAMNLMTGTSSFQPSLAGTGEVGSVMDDAPRQCVTQLAH